MRLVDAAGAERLDQQHNLKKARLEAGMPLADALVAGSCGGSEESGGCLSMPVEEIVQHPLPGYGAPVALSFSPDDRRVAFLYSPDGTLHRKVFTFDPAQRRQELLFGPPTAAGLRRATSPPRSGCGASVPGRAASGSHGLLPGFVLLCTSTQDAKFSHIPDH